jgi:hydroxyacylglutathione hydrolase
MQLVFEQVRTGGDRNFGYLLGDRTAGRCVLVDPSYAPETLVERAHAQRLTVSYIINTHGHADHTNGNERAAALTGAPIAAHPAVPFTPQVPLADGQALTVGSLRIQCLYTPGHCDDHLVLYETAHRLLLTGDLIFVGKVGGTTRDDDVETEWRSLQRVLASVPDEATVWPGHDYGVRPSSTIGLEKQTNPFLLCADLETFRARKRDWAAFKAQWGLK